MAAESVSKEAKATEGERNQSNAEVSAELARLGGSVGREGSASDPGSILRKVRLRRDMAKINK